MAFVPLTTAQTAALAPIDQALEDQVRENFDDLNSRAGSGGGAFVWRVNGAVSSLTNFLPFRRFDGAYVANARTFSNYGLFQERPGYSGVLAADIRKYKYLGLEIQSIANLFSDSVSSVALAGSSSSTTSIIKAMTQINTQSISFWKATINIDSIVLLGAVTIGATAYDNVARINLASATDADWAVGDSVQFASCTSGGNDGTFTIISMNQDSGNNLLVSNASAVAQTSAAGTAQLMAMSYNITNPASADLVAGEKAIFASHTTGANNGTFAIYAINQGGNNVIVKNASGATQAGIAGTIDSSHWTYNFGSALASDFTAGENAHCSGHTSSVNDGNLRIITITATSLTLYNPSGVAQGGTAGTVSTNRWVYALGSDHSSDVSVGHNVVAASMTSAPNDGTFAVVQVNRGSLNNVVVYNESGIAQASAAGTITTARKKVTFSSDQSAYFSVDKSRVGLLGLLDTTYNVDATLPEYSTEFTVLESNHGGGSNYNIVIENSGGATYSNPLGRVVFENRSIFSTVPSISSYDWMAKASNGVLDATEKVIADGALLLPEITDIQSGEPYNVVIHVS